MFNKKIILIISTIFLLTSCAGTWDSVKRGLTGQKRNSTDEFLVKKKDPLILPPKFDELPTPGERSIVKKETISIEENFETLSSTETSISDSPTEQSILQQIRKN